MADKSDYSKELLLSEIAPEYVAGLIRMAKRTKDVKLAKFIKQNVKLIKKYSFPEGLYIGIFNRATGISGTGLIKYARKERNLAISQRELRKYERYGLVEKVKDRNLYPLYTAQRLKFLRQCVRKYGYTTNQLREILYFENALIDTQTKNEGRYVAPYLIVLINTFFSRYGKKLLSSFKKRLHGPRTLYNLLGIAEKDEPVAKELFGISSRENGIVELTSKDIQQIKGFFQRLTAERLEQLPDDQREFLLRYIFENEVWMELSRLAIIENFREMVLQGFAPYADFVEYPEHGQQYKIEKLDWKWASELCYVSQITFFRTPHFEVRLKRRRININIIDPEKVDTAMMREIEKLYSKFRARLKPKRRAYGDKTGIREEKEKRDRLVKSMFKKMRKETSLKVLDIFDKIRRTGVPLADDSFKRIVYGLKKKC